MPTLRHRLAAALRRFEGLVEGDSVFGSGPGYWVNGTEIAHFDDDDVLDLRLTRALIRERRAALRADPRVTLRRSGSDWIGVRFPSAADVSFAAGLAELAVAAHRSWSAGAGPR